MSDNRTDERQTYPIPISNDIFAEYRRLGDAIWLYLFYIDRTTEEHDDGDGTFVGRVFGGVPRPDADAASALAVCDRTIRNWRERLKCEGFIRTKQTGHGSIVEVVNSRKWAWKRKQADRKDSSGQTGKNVPGRAERMFRSGRNESVVPYIDSTETVQRQTPLASDDAGDVAQQEQKSKTDQQEKKADPRFSVVRSFYIAEFQKRNPGVKAPFDGNDGKALKTLLEQQQDATQEKLNGWLKNAFQSDDVPPLRKGFRFRQFVQFYSQYISGPVRRDGQPPEPPPISRKELERRRTELSPEARRKYEEIGVKVPV